MEQLDVHLGGSRPLGYHYWPLPNDDPGVKLERESIRLVAPDGGLTRGLLWTPTTGRWKTAVILSHPRADFSVHYACPLLAAAGYAVCGFGTRYMNNDVDCIHEKAALDVKGVADEMLRRGAEAVIMLGNSGGGSLTALAHAEFGAGDGWVGLAAHPGEGVTMSQNIDPSVDDESDPFSVVPELDMYNPDNGWRPWPEPCHYDTGWLETYRAAQLGRIARLDAIARESLEFAEAARTTSRSIDKTADPANWRFWRARAVWSKYMVIYRTLANPAYLDLSIDPDDRALGSLFAHPDPMEGNYQRNGLARTMTARGWLSTWSALSSRAKMADTMPSIQVPTLLIHATADVEIRRREAQAIHDSSGAADKTLVEIAGAPHYLEGYRQEALDLVVEWLRIRFP